MSSSSRPSGLLEFIRSKDLSYSGRGNFSRPLKVGVKDSREAKYPHPLNPLLRQQGRGEKEADTGFPYPMWRTLLVYQIWVHLSPCIVPKIVLIEF